MSKNTDIGEILQAVEDKLVAKNIVGHESQVRWAEQDFPPHIKGDFDLILRPRRETNIHPVDDGSGRQGMRCSQVFDIFVRSSLATPELGDDKERIKKTTRIRRAVLDAIAGKMLADSADEDLLTMPVRWLGISDFNKDGNVKVKNLWDNVAMSFEVHYRPLINPDDYT